MISLTILNALFLHLSGSTDQTTEPPVGKVMYPDQPNSDSALVFCGSEIQGFTALFVDDDCSAYAQVTIVEDSGFRSSGEIPPSLVVVPGYKVNSRARFLKDNPFASMYIDGPADVAMEQVKRADLVMPSNYGSNRFTVTGYLGSTFMVYNLSVGSKYSVYMERCLNKANVKLFTALNVVCCDPFNVPLEPFFSGDDAQTAEARKKTTALSELTSTIMVIIIISSLILYLLITMIRSEVKKQKKIKRTALGVTMIEPTIQKPSVSTFSFSETNFQGVPEEIDEDIQHFRDKYYDS